MNRWGPVILLAAACGGAPKLECVDRDYGGPFCIPDGGRAANLDARLQLRDDCTSPCDQGAVTCAVRWDGGTTLALALVGIACYDPMAACPAVCGAQTYECLLPDLPDGTYTVTSMDQPPRTLEVGPGGAPSCRLP